MSRPLRSIGGGLSSRQLMFGFGLIPLPLSRFCYQFSHEIVLEVFPRGFLFTSHTHAHICSWELLHLFWTTSCMQRVQDQAAGPWGRWDVLLHALIPTAHLTSIQFHVPPRESRTAAGTRAASACPTATAWITYSHLRYGEVHALMRPGAPPTVRKYVLVCGVSPTTQRVAQKTIAALFTFSIK